MAEDNTKVQALRRLAILETQPLRTPAELLEWSQLRQWVLSHPDLLQQYREQHYFACAEEITKNEMPPKNPLPIFSRFLKWIFRR
tara:strand:- start:316 stop:570 length:255 start_codon:yes stop_codon:yes gene_type:complete